MWLKRGWPLAVSTNKTCSCENAEQDTLFYECFQRSSLIFSVVILMISILFGMNVANVQRVGVAIMSVKKLSGYFEILKSCQSALLASVLDVTCQDVARSRSPVHFLLYTRG